MTKKQFLKQLKEKLQDIENDELEEILNQYSSLIDEKIAMGKSEKEAVKIFGEVDEIAETIIKDYNRKNYKDKDIISNYSKKLMDYGERFFSFLSKKDTSELIKILIEVIVVIFLIGLCHIPISILEGLGKSVFYILSAPLNKIFYIIWKVVLELAYLALAILAFGKFIGMRYLNVEEAKDVKKYKVHVEVKKVNKEPYSLIKIGVVFLKFLAILILFGLSIYLMGMGLVLGICFYLLIKGVTYFGLYLVMLSLFLLGTLFFEILFDFVLDHKFRGGKI